MGTTKAEDEVKRLLLTVGIDKLKKMCETREVDLSWLA